MTTTKPIGEFVLDVHMLRQQVEGHKAEKAMREATWEMENAPLLAYLKEATAALEVAEQALRDAGITIYGATGNKQPYPGVEVKILTDIKYSEADAFAWAKEHAIALRLDTAAFSKLAHAINDERKR